jgi:DNA-binding transcriptional ArsR family regulator
MDLDDVFSVLADSSRRRIVTVLAADVRDEEHACGSFDLPVSKATRTHHFRVLREAGLIEQRFHGNGSSIRLRRQDVERVWPGLLALLLRNSRGPADQGEEADDRHSSGQHDEGDRT